MDGGGGGKADSIDLNTCKHMAVVLYNCCAGNQRGGEEAAE